MVIRKKSINPDAVSQDDSSLPRGMSSDSAHLSQLEHLSDRIPFFQRLSLRAKVALFAIVIGTLPVIGTGIIHTWLSRSIDQARLQNSPTQENTDGVAQPFLLAYVGITLNAILAVGMAVFLTDCVIRPVLQTSSAVRKLGQGHLETRLAAQGNDELAVLAANINWMADQFQSRFQQPSAKAQPIQLLKQVNFHLAQAKQLDESLHSVVQAIRQVFQFDRVLIYRIDPSGVSTLVAESVEPEWISLMDRARVIWLQSTIEQPQGAVEAIADIAENLPEAYSQELASLSIKASLSAPIVIHDQCLGILIAHQCRDPYVWQTTEIDTWAQLAMQIGLAWERTRDKATIAQLMNQQEMMAQTHCHQQELLHAQETLLQTQLTELLEDFERAASGDLTVRTTITCGNASEIAAGEANSAQACEAIAQVFNATFEQLHQIVAEVNQRAGQLHAVAAAAEPAIHQLNETTTRQTEALTTTYSTIKALMGSLQTITAQLQQVSSDVQIVLDTAEKQAQMLKRTETNCAKWQDVATRTIAQATEFRNNCQRVTTTATLVDQLIFQVNRLASSASIEASQGRGVAQGFGLATAQISESSNQLRTAMQEVEQWMFKLQHEVSRGVRETEQEISWMAQGDFGEVSDQQVELTEVSASQIKQTMQSIAQTVGTQVDAAQILLNSVQQMASESQDVSSKTAQVARSHQQLVTVVQHLQNSIRALKIRQPSA